MQSRATVSEPSTAAADDDAGRLQWFQATVISTELRLTGPADEQPPTDPGTGSMRSPSLPVICAGGSSGGDGRWVHALISVLWGTCTATRVHQLGH